MLCHKVRINYTVACVILGILFVLQKTVLVSDIDVLSEIVDFLQWPFLLYVMSTLLPKKIKRRKLILYLLTFVILCLFLISYKNSGLANIFKYAVLIVAARNNKDLQILKSFRNSYFVLVASVFILGLLRIIPSRIVRRNYFTYGFIHSNVLAMFVFTIICCDIMYNYQRIKTKRVLLYTTIITATVLLTDCRSVAIGYISVLLFLIYFKFRRNESKLGFIGLLLSVMPIILTVLSFYVAYNYDVGNALFLTLNKISSERLYLANQLTRYFSLTLLGQDCGSLLMENSYITVFFAWGIIPGVVAIATYCYAIYNAISKNMYGVSVCLLGFAFQGLFEGSAFELFENLALLATFII